jgi:predicted transcriptional regulator
MIPMLPDESPAPDLVTLAGDVVAAYVTKNSVRTGCLGILAPETKSPRELGPLLAVVRGGHRVVG